MRWKSPDSPRAKIARMSKSEVMTLLIISWTSNARVVNSDCPDSQSEALSPRFGTCEVAGSSCEAMKTRPHTQRFPSVRFWWKSRSYSWNISFTYQVCVTSSSYLPRRIIPRNHILKCGRNLESEDDRSEQFAGERLLASGNNAGINF
jgi:hypothetical protein